MMSALTFEEFVQGGTPSSTSISTAGDQAAPPDTEKPGYEAGYAAGWEDACHATEDAAHRMKQEVGQGLQDISFSYHEARAHLLRSVEPLLTELFENLLPPALLVAFPALLRESLIPAVEKCAGAPLDLVIPQGCRELVQPYLEGFDSVPLRIIEDQDLIAGQAIIRSGEIETLLDIPDALACISNVFRSFSYPIEKEEIDALRQHPRVG